MTEPCQHHWLVDTPNGDKLLAARCKHCGKERTYRAYTEETWLERKGAGQNIKVD